MVGDVCPLIVQTPIFISLQKPQKPKAITKNVLECRYL